MTELDLKTDADEVRKVYFRDDIEKYFFGPETKQESMFLVVAAIIFPFTTAYSLYHDDNARLLLGCVLFGLIIYSYWRVAKPIFKWKKSVIKLLEDVKKIQIQKFQYNDNHFIHTQDSHVLKQEWTVIERAAISDRYITLNSNTQVILIKSSMTDDQFEALSKMVMDKVKNVEKE